MVLRAEHHRWRVATWRLGDPARHTGRSIAPAIDHMIDSIIEALGALEADVVGLQWIRSRPARTIAAELDLPHRWVRSHHPRRPPFPGSAIGLSVMTPHRIASATTTIVGDHASRWSPRRRVAQIVEIARADRASCTFCHATGPLPADADRLVTGAPTTGAPVVVVGRSLAAAGGHGGDRRGPVVVPHGATTVSTERSHPIDGVAPLVTTVFETAWIEGGFATG